MLTWRNGIVIGAALLLLAGQGVTSAGADDPLDREPSSGVEAPQDMATPVVGDGLAVDAVSYAKTFGVPLESARVRLQLQQDLDAVSGELARLAGNDLAGLHLVHEPDVSLVVRVVDAVPPELAQKVASSDLPITVEVTHQQPLSELITVVEKTPWTELDDRVQGVYADERSGTIVVHLLGNDRDAAAFEARAESASSLSGVPVQVETVDTPGGDANRGGRNLTSCTSSFTVSDAAGTQGMLTAGHCSNAQSYYCFSGNGPFAMTFVSEVRSATADLQWHTTTAQAIEPLFHADSTTTARPQQGVGVGAVGQCVCRRGKTSGYACTTVESITCRPVYDGACPGTTCAAVFSLTSGAAVAAGDSGGPWFIGNVSHGTTKGYVGSKSIYTRVWYLNTLGLSLLQG